MPMYTITYTQQWTVEVDSMEEAADIVDLIQENGGDAMGELPDSSSVTADPIDDDEGE